MGRSPRRWRQEVRQARQGRSGGHWS
jgi:hypothetical protein